MGLNSSKYNGVSSTNELSAVLLNNAYQVGGSKGEEKNVSITEHKDYKYIKDVVLKSTDITQHPKYNELKDKIRLEITGKKCPSINEILTDITKHPDYEEARRRLTMNKSLSSNNITEHPQYTEMKERFKNKYSMIKCVDKVITDFPEYHRIMIQNQKMRVKLHTLNKK